MSYWPALRAPEAVASIASSTSLKQKWGLNKGGADASGKP